MSLCCVCGVQWLVLWTDCDREGEYIAYEVVDAVKRTRPRIRAFRARFSSLIDTDIWRAVGSLGQLDPRQRDVRGTVQCAAQWLFPTRHPSIAVSSRLTHTPPWRLLLPCDCDCDVCVWGGVWTVFFFFFFSFCQAVAARNEIDLRLGAIFTRFQVCVVFVLGDKGGGGGGGLTIDAGAAGAAGAGRASRLFDSRNILARRSPLS